jgi:hypothetical protein
MLTKRPRRKKSASPQVSAFVVCLRNDGYEVSLEPKKLYAVLADPEAAKHRQLRVVDESGDDYLYPTSLFAHIALPQEIRKAVLAAG